MNWTDVLKIAAAILTSVGGAGTIILGLSNYLGKLWADRALEKEKHHYAAMLQNAKNELDLAANRYQVELDSLSLAHKLRMTEEFSRLGQLWKYMAILQDIFTVAAGLGVQIVPADPEENKKYKAALRREFEKALTEARDYFLQEKLFIPQIIATAAEGTLKHAIQDKNFYDLFFDHHEAGVRFTYTQGVEQRLVDFKYGMTELERLMREHIEGMKH